MINFDDLDLNEAIPRKNIFSFSDFGIDTLLGCNFVCKVALNVLSISLLLYPLERVQQIKQIQSTYSSESIKFCNNVFTRCSHFGIRSIFRGLKVTLIKNSMLYSIYEFVDKFQYQQNRLAENIFKGLVAAMGYSITYPFENIKLRMAADLQQQRYYDNIRDCVKKIKKHQGTAALYRGFSIASIHLLSQFFLIKTLINLRQKYQNQISNPLIFTSLFLTSFAAYETILYPLDTLKYNLINIRKNMQINGSLGHDDYNKNLRKTLKNITFASYFNGLPVRMANSACYVCLSLIIGKVGNQNKH